MGAVLFGGQKGGRRKWVRVDQHFDRPFYLKSWVGSGLVGGLGVCYWTGSVIRVGLV